MLTAYGEYRYYKISPEEARTLVAENGKLKANVISAIGHQATAQYLASLLGVEIPVQRINISMVQGDKAIVIKSASRLPEGKVLSIEEMAMFGWEISLLERTA